MSPRFPRYETLPETIPVFPLDGVLLLPHGQLPLNVFEPRYLAMVDDALKAERLIGMIQPREEERTGAPPRLYEVGCAGRITTLDETDDGRYLVTLTGVCRFRIRAEVPTMRGYRRVEADWAPFKADFDQTVEEVDKPHLLKALAAYFDATGLSANWEAIEKTPGDRLVTSLAMICPFDAPEKQALLEAPDLAERTRVMISLFEMAVAGRGRRGDEPARH